MTDTPRCNALESHLLDSFDYRAWVTLAKKLERELEGMRELAILKDKAIDGHIAARTEARAHVAYMNATGNVMSVETYDEHLNTPAWRWVIEKHWTPATKLYAESPQREKP